MDMLVSYKSIHFIGIGGVSMKALAKYCMLQGIRVSGSDINQSSAIDRLSRDGIDIVPCDDVESISGCDLIVYTAAIACDNPQLVAAKSLRIPVMERKAFLGLVSRGFNKVISVAGTHGKTTCTAMISCVFDRADMSYTGHIGGDLQGKEYNLIYRGNDCFVTEACEYNRSFLTLCSDIAIVLNVGFDHPDCYRDMDDMVKAY
ncbi:MAG: UDP-N-acetylmuramate--L-alanine ligase, partial [Clostridia bacterium]|nr:UDP-N-acetylmuramate--L-alanine ligase [Clostridia bacterium]